MNREDAKRTLLCYRPGTADASDPEIAEAIAVCETDGELREWFADHCAFQAEMRKKLRSVPVPGNLKAHLKASVRIVPVPMWRRPHVWQAAAAALLIFGGVAGLLWKPATLDQFAKYQLRMVGSAVREYRMDVVTGDMAALRRHLAGGGAPADYEVPASLKSLQLTGGGVLRWRNHPVGMACFDRGDRQMLFLFVTRRSAFKDPPAEKPQVSRMADMLSVSWSAGDKCYTLAGPEDSQVLRKYL